MKILAMPIAGRADWLCEEILRAEAVEDYEYFVSGLCVSLLGGCDSEWDGFIEDHSAMYELLSILHIQYRPFIEDYVERSSKLYTDHPLGFEVSLNPMPLEGMTLLMAKCFYTFDQPNDPLAEYINF